MFARAVMWLRKILRAHIVRPYNLNKPDGGGGVLDAPFRPRRGQSGEGHRSVKKNAALLHFLAFGSFDLRFGVLRGEQPLSRAPRLGSSGTFVLLFCSQKSRHSGRRPL